LLAPLRQAVLACTRAMAVGAMVVVGLMMLTISYDVVARYAFAAPTDWAYPLNAAGVLTATALAVPYLYAGGHHISMDLLHRALPDRWRRAADAVTAAATVFLGLVLTATAFRSMTVAYAGGLTGAGTFNIPLWVPDTVLVLAGVFLILVALLFPASRPDESSPAPVPGDAALHPEQQDVSR